MPPRPPSVRGSAAPSLAKIEGFGTQPRGVANSSFLVKRVDKDLNEVGDQFEVYARIQTETANFDLDLCTPHYQVGDHIDIRQTKFPIGGAMITGWFADGTFQSTDCECD